MLSGVVNGKAEDETERNNMPDDKSDETPSVLMCRKGNFDFFFLFSLFFEQGKLIYKCSFHLFNRINGDRTDWA